MPSIPEHAIVLAAGAGSRLQPLTDLVPKPLLPIDGRAVLAHVLDALGAAGIAQVTIVVGPHAALVRAFVRVADPGWPAVCFVEQHEPRGTAHALQCVAAARERSHEPDECIVTAADMAWSARDLTSFTQAAVADTEAMVTMAVQHLPVDRLPHGNHVEVDHAGCVGRVLAPIPADLRTRPDATATAGAALYHLRPAAWPAINAVQPSAHGGIELASAIQALVDAGQLVRARTIAAPRDLTRPADLLRHNFPYLAALLDDDLR